MKIIITESQYKKLTLQRRLADIMDEGAMIIDYADEFYGDTDFCRHYPTLEVYMEGMTQDIIHQYGYISDAGVEGVWNFIHDEVGFKNFIDMLLEEHGDKIVRFYKEKTKEC
jgi:hypothetical protein